MLDKRKKDFHVWNRKMKSLFDDAMEAHMKLGFPDFPEDDDFSDWMGELAELDGYYAGLATSNMGSSRPKKISKDQLFEHADRLAQFSSLEAEDRDIFLAAEAYIQSLSKMVDIANTKQK